MTYSYACACGTKIERQYRIGAQLERVRCSGCGELAERDYHADFSGVTMAPVDPFRSYDLSTAKMRAEGEQQRHIDAPRDSFERNHLEKSLGRTYIGNDSSVLRKHAQDGIRAYQESKG